ERFAAGDESRRPFRCSRAERFPDAKFETTNARGLRARGGGAPRRALARVPREGTSRERPERARAQRESNCGTARPVPRTGGLKARTIWAEPMKNSAHEQQRTRGPSHAAAARGRAGSATAGTGGGRAVRPGKQGLYDPWYEHDACGVGFVVDVKGR